MSVNDKRRNKPLASGKRGHDAVIKLRDTGDDNYMKVVRDQHERRKILNRESKYRAPKPVTVVDTRKVIRQKDDPAMKNERVIEPKRKQERKT